MKRKLFTGLFAVVLAAIMPIVGLPGNVRAEQVSASHTIEQWKMLEIPFCSAGPDQQLLTGGAGGTFEGDDALRNWSAFGGGALSASNDIAHSGSSSLKLSNRTGSWFSPRYDIYNIVKENGAGKYNISLWVNVDSLSSSPGNGRIIIRGNSVGQYSFFNQGNDYGIITNTFSTPAATWVQYSGSVIITEADIANPTGNMFLMIDTLAGLEGQSLYIDDVKVTKDPYDVPFDDVTMDVAFTAPDGTVMVMPAFWDGNNTWKVRFAPTQTGIWSYVTDSLQSKSIFGQTDSGLHNQIGMINCVPYEGDLLIYQKGFVNTKADTKYFAYDDGTPFFYIGDTHWSLISEPFETMFKTVVDDRVNKGFTVYQSQPMSAFNFNDGVTELDLPKLKDLDARFEYIANAGLVHANSQIAFTDIIDDGSIFTDEYLEQLSRLWVARYAAYPVMWTTAQEVDKDNYGRYADKENPWLKVFSYIHEYDPYQHPQTAHQENTGSVRLSTSTFKDLPGYDWFGVQWAPRKNGLVDFNLARDYWENGNGPAVNYEGHYENLWTNDFGARHQGWTAFLNGMYGHGYGTADIWYYNSNFQLDTEDLIFGITITPEMKSIKWQDSMNSPVSTQLGTYMREFFESMQWWKLAPRFDDKAWFDNDADQVKEGEFQDGSWYSLATNESDTYVAYLYNKDSKSGELRNMDSVPYVAKWFDPKTGVYTDIGTILPTDGKWVIPGKPDANDWVLYVTKAHF